MIGIHHLLKRQLPEFVREKYPTFCKFLDYYYRWLMAHGFSKLEKITDIDLVCDAITISDELFEEIPFETLKSYIGYEIKDTVNNSRASILGVSEDGKLLIRYITKDAKFCEDGNSDPAEIQKIVDDDKISVNIDKIYSIPTIFIENFSYMLDTNKIVGFDNENIALLLKHIKEYYTVKGTEESVNFLLYVLKGVDSTVMYPWENVLKPSDGRWHQYYSIVLKTTKEDIEKLTGEESILKIANYGVLDYKSFNIKSIEFFKNEKYLITDTGEYEQYIRIHLYEKPNTVYFDVGSYCYIDTENNGTFEGEVVKDITSITINDGGSNWSVGEVFKIGGTDEWKVEDNSYDVRTLDSSNRGQWYKRFNASTSIGDDSDYNDGGDLYTASRAESPFLGRVTACDSGSIYSIEVLQSGEYIRYDDTSLYEISPLLYENRSSWDSTYNAFISFNFDVVNSEVGYWDDERGFLSYPDIVLQDSTYYQQFSYDVFTESDPSDFVELLKDIHPSGTKQFNTQLIVDTWDLSNNLQFDVAFPYVLIENCYSQTNIEERLYKYFYKDLTVDGYKDFALAMESDFKKTVKKVYLDPVSCREIEFLLTYVKVIKDFASFTEKSLILNFNRKISEKTNIDDSDISKKDYRFISEIFNTSDKCSKKFNISPFKDSIDISNCDVGDGTFIYNLYNGYDSLNKKWVERVVDQSGNNISYIANAFAYYLLTNISGGVEGRVIIEKNGITYDVKTEVDGKEYQVEGNLI